MKTIALCITLFLATQFSVKAQEQTVTITIENVLNDQGHILAALHTGETFMKGMGIDNQKIKAEKGKITFSFKNVKPGTYAVMVLHDKNDNQQMDFEPSGMPKEEYGTSNNVMAMGPPQFSDAKFKIEDEDLNLTIKL